MKALQTSPAYHHQRHAAGAKRRDLSKFDVVIETPRIAHAHVKRGGRKEGRNRHACHYAACIKDRQKSGPAITVDCECEPCSAKQVLPNAGGRIACSTVKSVQGHIFCVRALFCKASAALATHVLSLVPQADRGLGPPHASFDAHRHIQHREWHTAGTHDKWLCKIEQRKIAGGTQGEEWPLSGLEVVAWVPGMSKERKEGLELAAFHPGIHQRLHGLNLAAQAHNAHLGVQHVNLCHSACNPFLSSHGKTASSCPDLQMFDHKHPRGHKLQLLLAEPICSLEATPGKFLAHQTPLVAAHSLVQIMQARDIWSAITHNKVCLLAMEVGDDLHA
eukprot:593331-Pelagomonas_calceolata.AAC.3